MRKARFTEHQIIAVLKSVEAGRTVKDVCRHACRALSLSKTVYFYKPDTRRDESVIQALTEAAERYPRYGFKKLFQILRRQGNGWNYKRVHRIYCLLKLNFRRKGKQRLPDRKSVV